MGSIVWLPSVVWDCFGSLSFSALVIIASLPLLVVKPFTLLCLTFMLVKLIG